MDCQENLILNYVYDQYQVLGHYRVFSGKCLRKAVDQTRRDEFRRLSRKNRKAAQALKGSRHLFLWNMDKIPEGRHEPFDASRRAASKTADVWESKEAFMPSKTTGLTSCFTSEGST